MGSKGGGGSGGSTTTKNIPYDPKKISEYLDLLLQQAAPGFTGAPGTGELAANPFPPQQVAPLNPTEQQGITAAVTAGEQGQGPASSVLNEANQTASGDYLSIPQSYLDALNRSTTTEYQNTIAPTELGNAASVGAFGGSADAEARALDQFGLSRSLADANAGVYEQERSNQIATQQQLPAIEAGAGVPSEQILSAGGVQQQQAQQELNTQYANSAQQAQWPYELLSFLGSGVTGIGGGTSTTTSSSPFANNTAGNVIGGVSTGLGALSSIALLASLL